jgi:hypothetical protein
MPNEKPPNALHWIFEKLAKDRLLEFRQTDPPAKLATALLAAARSFFVLARAQMNGGGKRTAPLF